MNEEADTIAATPHARPPSAGPSSPPPSGVLPTTGGGSIAASAAMHSEEAVRARAFFRLIVAVLAAAIAFMPFVEGPPTLRISTMALCVVLAAVGAYALRALRDERRYNGALVTGIGIVFAVLGELVVFHLGLFTGAVMVLPLGLYFFGLSESATAARATYGLGAVLYLLLSVGVVLGMLPDLGPMPIGRLPVAWRWFFVIMSQVVFAAAFFLARSSRRATEIAIASIERATRQIHLRDALLAEARGELDRVQVPGEGRYTGQQVAGYRLGEVVGRGGMGEVYRAEHEKTNEVAAVKLLHPSVLADPEHVKRFVREAEIAQRVDSSYVARVKAAGLSPSGIPFVVMELLSGRDLAWHLRRAGKLPLTGVVELVDHTCRALVAIRDAGIVHRDLKPHNLVLNDGEARRWKVLDFGVSRYEAGGSTLTQGAMVGTPSYMAPEQVRLEPVDHTTDLYALANVVYRALTGKPAFAGDDVAGVLYHVVHTPPPRPAALVRLPTDVELVLAIGMAKAREDRFARAEEFAEAFRRAARSDLDAETRARGARMLEKYPWSTAEELRAAG